MFKTIIHRLLAKIREGYTYVEMVRVPLAAPNVGTPRGNRAEARPDYHQY
jgi:hypothetical protein